MPLLMKLKIIHLKNSQESYSFFRNKNNKNNGKQKRNENKRTLKKINKLTLELQCFE
jgi:hypothetical protein